MEVLNELLTSNPLQINFPVPKLTENLIRESHVQIVFSKLEPEICEDKFLWSDSSRYDSISQIQR